MRRIVFVLLFLIQLSALAVSGQVKPRTLYDSAYIYYNRKDFKKAAHFFDTYYIELKQGESNNDTFYAAIASCQSGNRERASYYLRRSGEIGYDYSSYNTFMNDPLAACLKDLPEWEKYAATFRFKTDSISNAVKKINDGLTDQSKRVNKSLLTDSNYLDALYKKNSGSSLALIIKQFNDFPALTATGNWTLYQMKINDSLTVPYLLYIPKKYDHRHKMPLYIYLHGGAAGKLTFSDAVFIPGGAQIKIMDSAKEQGAFILYPFAKKDFNWLNHQAAFEVILNEISQVKSLYNINDNKVFMGGHSDGGRGAFWFAINKPTAFASFFCLNYFPSLLTGNTSLRNLNNAPEVFGVSGTRDGLFPVKMVTEIYQYAVKNGANWKNYTFDGEHDFSIFHRDSISFIFDSLKTINRNPFPEKIEWETDNVSNGRNAWIAITQLDTLAGKAPWQEELNPVVTNDGKAVRYNFNRHKSGAVTVKAEGNVIHILASRVKEISVYVSADMFDLKKKILIYVNHKLLFNKKVMVNKDVVFNEFLRTRDRTFIAADKISLMIK